MGTGPVRLSCGLKQSHIFLDCNSEIPNCDKSFPVRAKRVLQVIIKNPAILKTQCTVQPLNSQFLVSTQINLNYFFVCLPQR